MSSESEESGKLFHPYECVCDTAERLLLHRDHTPLESVASLVTIVSLVGYLFTSDWVFLIPVFVSIVLAFVAGGGVIRVDLSKAGIGLKRSFMRITYTAEIPRLELRSISCSIYAHRRTHTGQLFVIAEEGRTIKILAISRATETELLEDLQAISDKIGAILSIPVESLGSTV